MITIMGATGQVGGKITTLLLGSGRNVKALGRSESKLAELKSAGAEVAAGDAHDTAFLTEAFRGSEAIYIMLPSDPTVAEYLREQEKLADTIRRAARESGVRYIVALSSIGADLPSGTGFIESLYIWEQHLRLLADANVLLLRPGYFYENFRESLGQVQSEGIIGDSIAPEVRIPMIATRDIAAVAARSLMACDWQGVVVRELMGPRDLTMSEVAALIGKELGKPDLQYLQFSGSDMISALTEFGISEDFARLHVETGAAISSGTIRPGNSGKDHIRTQTRFEDFVPSLKEVYESR